MVRFVKLSELTAADRTKLRDYFKELWGDPFAKALVTDYKPGGKKKTVKAQMQKTAEADALSFLSELSPREVARVVPIIEEDLHTYPFEVLLIQFEDMVQQLLADPSRNTLVSLLKACAEIAPSYLKHVQEQFQKEEYDIIPDEEFLIEQERMRIEEPLEEVTFEDDDEERSYFTEGLPRQRQWARV